MKKYNFPAGTAVTRALFTRNVSEDVNYHALTAATAAEIALVEGAKYVEVSTDQVVYVRFGDEDVVAAAVPSADVTDGSAVLPVADGDVLVIPADATHVSVIGEANGGVTLAYFS